MKFSTAIIALCTAGVVSAQGGKKGNAAPDMSMGGKKGGMEEPTECPAVTPLTCGSEETGSSVREITSCGFATQAAGGSGVYVLTDDLECPQGQPAILIDSDDVTLDCQGNTITTSGDCDANKAMTTLAGISIADTGNTVNNVVLKNCVVSCFAFGINAEDTQNLLIKNVKAMDNASGTQIVDSTGTTIADSIFDGNDSIGLDLSGSSVTVVDSTANMNGQNGVGVGDRDNAVSAFLSGVQSNGNGMSGLVYTGAGGNGVTLNLQNYESCDNTGADVDEVGNNAVTVSQSGTRCGSDSDITCECQC